MNDRGWWRLARLALTATLVCGLVALAVPGPAGATVGDGVSMKSAPKPTKSHLPKRSKPKTFAEGLAAQLGPNGEGSLKAALAAFTTIFGKLPGAHVAALPTKGSGDATLAVSMLLGHWTELTKAQQARAEDLLGEGAPATTSGGGGKRVGSQVDLITARAFVGLAVRDISARLGRTIPIPEVRLDDYQPPGGVEAEGWAAALDAQGHTWRPGRGSGSDVLPGCRITLFNGSNLSGAALNAVVTHETFHCFQYAILPAARIYGSARSHVHAWIFEGTAEWVAETLHPGDATAAGFWEDWLEEPLATGLFRRSYDAIGFFSALGAQGTDPWSVLDAVLRASTDDNAAYAAATGGQGAAVLPRVASGVSRIPILGSVWETRGPGMPGLTSVRGAYDVPAVSPETPRNMDDPMAPISVGGFQTSVSGDVLEVRSSAHVVAVGFTGGRPTVFSSSGTFDRRFCLLAGGCVCPDGSAAQGSPFAAGASGTVGIGVGNERTSSAELTMTLTAFHLQDLCHGGARTTSACFPGTYRPTATPEVPAQFASSLSSFPGYSGITGGVGGRTVEFAAGGAWTAHDTGADQIYAHGSAPGIGPIQAAFPVVSVASGTYSTTSGNHISFATGSYTYLSNPPAFNIIIAGNLVAIPLPDEVLRSMGTFNGSGTYSCSGNTLVLTLDTGTLRLQRA